MHLYFKIEEVEVGSLIIKLGFERFKFLPKFPSILIARPYTSWQKSEYQLRKNVSFVNNLYSNFHVHYHACSVYLRILFLSLLYEIAFFRAPENEIWKHVDFILQQDQLQGKVSTVVEF